ncbi:four helix bundle protein [Thermodesulfatator indicus]
MLKDFKRLAYSVPANIVEGTSKRSKKEFLRYHYILEARLRG